MSANPPYPQMGPHTYDTGYEDSDQDPDLPRLLAEARKVTVEVQWAVDLGFAVSRARDEEHARLWVKGYEDNPDAVTDGDPMPAVVRRTVTTTPWTSVTPPGEQHG